MNNYEFCAQWVISQEHGKNVRVLDYGCGAGQVVKELHKLGIHDAFGCDVFYEGSSIDPNLLGSTIRRMVGNAIPFDNKRTFIYSWPHFLPGLRNVNTFEHACRLNINKVIL